MSQLHPPNCMPLELQVAHYIKQVVELRRLNAEMTGQLSMDRELILELREMNAECDTAADGTVEEVEGLVREWRAQDMRDVEKEMNALAALGGLLE